MLLIIAASNGQNLELALELQKIAHIQGYESKVIDLSSYSLPLYTSQEQLKGIPHTIDSLSKEFQSAQRIIFCAPEYNGTVPPVLTNAIAWVSVYTDHYRDAFNHKVGALATHSGGQGTKVLKAMRMMLTTMGMKLIDHQIQNSSRHPFQIEDGEMMIRQVMTTS